MLKFSVISIVLLLLSCTSASERINSNDKKEKAAIEIYPTKPLIVDNGEEEGWGVDIRLSITSIDTATNITVYTAQSTYQSKNVGLIIEFPNNGKDALKLKANGKASENLLAVLSHLYKLQIDSGQHFITSIEVPYIDLHAFAKQTFGTNDTLGQMAPKEYKLFFHGQKEQEYAEFYLNINDKQQWLELREKDPEYRPLLVKFLSGQ